MSSDLMRLAQSLASKRDRPKLKEIKPLPGKRHYSALSEEARAELETMMVLVQDSIAALQADRDEMAQKLNLLQRLIEDIEITIRTMKLFSHEVCQVDVSGMSLTCDQVVQLQKELDAK